MRGSDDTKNEYGTLTPLSSYRMMSRRPGFASGAALMSRITRSASDGDACRSFFGTNMSRPTMASSTSSHFSMLYHQGFGCQSESSVVACGGSSWWLRVPSTSS